MSAAKCWIDAVPEVVPLKIAYLCEDCENISSAFNGSCTVCGSRSVLSLASVLNRKTEGTHDEVL